MSDPILEARDVHFGYRHAAPVLAGVSFAVRPGRSMALVGESGAGKTTLLRLLLGLARPGSGAILFDGRELDLRDRARRLEFRRGVQTVFQDPYSSLDPRQRVSRIVAEPLRSLGLGSAVADRDTSRSSGLGSAIVGPDVSRTDRQAEIRRRVTAALDSVGLPADAADRYPHEFSGGQRQRIAIARAIVCEPRVLLADEPVSALDVTTRVRIVDLLAELTRERGLTVVMVSHDLGVVATLCEDIAVLERGRIVERGAIDTVLGSPSHPYTRRLIASAPRLPSGRS
ncbi:ABC transporter ATP-binding protein [Rugosimonospora africana]|uniref:Dipeptide/oligopeptide/nickel ABC transporter ATP-binding protein n=1 Tax=Rugosimonospora africana TaxID=556532 RepID=A0A8J3VR19_9ACTN|nr:ABC transporter ATP-binding protein [Rugosimonospora africana]GIH15684.1 dipeptide/oligopeptide/nickel ABC transporter ATP-binding protein [Rugosimonospora africana]